MPVEKKRPKLMTVSELARRLSVCGSTIRKLLKKGMPHYKIKSHFRLDKEEVLKWLREKTIEERKNRDEEKREEK